MLKFGELADPKHHWELTGNAFNLPLEGQVREYCYRAYDRFMENFSHGITLSEENRIVFRSLVELWIARQEEVVNFDEIRITANSGLLCIDVVDGEQQIALPVTQRANSGVISALGIGIEFAFSTGSRIALEPEDLRGYGRGFRVPMENGLLTYYSKNIPDKDHDLLLSNIDEVTLVYQD